MATSIICCCAPTFPSVFARFGLPKALSSFLSSMRSSKGRSAPSTDRGKSEQLVPMNVSHPNQAWTKASAAQSTDGRPLDGYGDANTDQDNAGPWVLLNVNQPNVVWTQVPIGHHTDRRPSYGCGLPNLDLSQSGPWVPMRVSQLNLASTQIPMVHHTDGQPSYGHGFDTGSYDMAPIHVIDSSDPARVTYAQEDAQYV